MPSINNSNNISQIPISSPDLSSKKTQKKLNDREMLNTLQETFSFFTPDIKDKKITRSNKEAPTEIKTDVQGQKILKEKNVSKSTHTFSLKLPESVKLTAVKVATVAATVLFGAIGLIGVGAAKAYFAIKGKIMAKMDPNNLELASDNMKKTEEAEKFAALKGVAQKRDWLKDLNRTNQDLMKVELKQQKLERVFVRALERNGKTTPYDQIKVQNECQQLTHNDFKDEASLLAALKKLSPEMQVLVEPDNVNTLLKELAATRDPNPSVDYKKTLSELDALLKSSPKDPASTNQKITGKLREALESPVYQALKEDTHNQSVKFLQSLASAIWNDVQALDAYNTMGEAVLRRVPEKDKKDASMSSLLMTSQKKASQELLTDHGIPGKILYALRNPVQALSSMASEGGALRAIAGVFGKDVYDSHGVLSNNPSLQGVTKASIKTGNQTVSGSINNCYGGSPTIGDDKISPEFEAICQAAENKRYNPTAYTGLNIPDKVYYTNFQNIENTHGEGARSRTIMDLNQRFPLSFTGITLSKDSDFYLMPKHKRHMEEINWEGSAKFGQDMMEKLKNDACFGYENRQGSKEGSGFYFPGTKEEWVPIFEKCIESAQRHFTGAAPVTGKEAYSLRGAFQEYVYSMIQAHTELKLVQDAGVMNSKPVLTAIRACKENIDRGGAENTKYMYTRLSPDHELRESLITGVFQGRALSVRGRVILEHRLDQILSFMDHVKPEDFQEEMRGVMTNLGIEFADGGEPEFVPALKSTPPSS